MFDLTGLINASMPAIIALIQQRHHEAVPDAPALTDEEVFAALHDSILESITKDDAIAADIRRRNPDE